LRKFINILKKKYNIEEISSRKVKIPNFLIYGGKYNFKLNKLWTIKNFTNPTYLVSYKTKYNIEITGTGAMSYLTEEADENHMSMIVKSPVLLPDLVIRPRNITDLISDPILRKRKRLNGELKFNLKFILELNNKAEDLSFLRRLGLIDKIYNQKYFWMEIKDSHFTFHFQNGIKLKNLLAILEITELINHNIKTKI